MSRMVFACALIALLVTLSAARLVQPLPVLAASGLLTVQTPLHDAPHPDATVLALLPEGTEVAIDGPPVDGFYPVSAGGFSGWMRGETLVLTKDVPIDGLTGLPATELVESVPIDPLISADSYPLQDAITYEKSAEPLPSAVPTPSDPVLVELPPSPSPDSGLAQPAATDPAAEPPLAEAPPVTSESEALAATPVPPAEPVPTGDGATKGEAPAEDGTAAPVDGTGPTGPASVMIDAPIRTGPGPGFDLIFTVPQGSTVEQTGQIVDGYVTVRYKEVTGWLALSDLAAPSDFVPEPPPEATSAPVETKIPRPGSGVAYTTVDLSLRDGPSATAAPVAAVPAGSRVVLTGVMEGGFQRVTFRDQIGWIANDYLQTPPHPEEAPKAKIENYSRREIVRIIYAAADRYGQSREDMLRVAQCESNLDPYAVNPSGSYGLFQFIRTTWRSTPYGDQDVFDPRANANAAGWMWAQGRKSEWVCQ